jgi:hypothetical protein
LLCAFLAFGFGEEGRVVVEKAPTH